MKRFLSIVAFMLFALVMTGTNRALVVCVGDYPEGSGWRDISSGRDRDLVVTMLHGSGFCLGNITVLSDSEATHSGILKALSSLAGDCRVGDVVYVHFSCHGQQVTDLNGDEPDGWDEALIPYDANAVYGANGYLGQNHLLDDELNVYLEAIAQKVGSAGLVILVSDACHSGDNDRYDEDVEDPLMRGIYDRFVIPGEPARKPASRQEQGKWIRLSACREYQNNYEVVVDGKSYGRLSYSLSRVFGRGVDASSLILLTEREYAKLPVKTGRPVQKLDSSVPESLKNRIIAE